MTVHGGYTITATQLRPRGKAPRRRRANARLVGAAVVLLAVGAIVAAPTQLGDAAARLCTIGTPSGTSCAEALVYLGYP